MHTFVFTVTQIGMRAHTHRHIHTHTYTHTHAHTHTHTHTLTHTLKYCRSADREEEGWAGIWWGHQGESGL